jgi:hypothetical protein
LLRAVKVLSTSTDAVINTITFTPGYNSFALGNFIMNGGSGCAGVPTTFSIIVNPLPDATITAAGSLAICSGSSVKLDANTGLGLTYQWKKDGTNIAAATSASYTATAAGSYTVVVTNSNGCSKTSAATAVTVYQQLQFTTCPSNLSASTTAGSCNAVVNYTAAVAGAPSPALSYTFTGATTGSGTGTGSGVVFNKGVTTVTITATNLCGSVTCSFTVSVIDNEAPAVRTKNITVYLDATGHANITAAQVDNGSSDNCGTVALSVSPNTFDCANLGANTVTLSVADGVSTTNTDQQNTSGGTPAGFSNVAQTFTAGSTGSLSAVELKLAYWNVTNPTGVATLAIYSGAGIGGQLLSTQPIALLPEGIYPNITTAVTYNLAAPVAVIAGQVYSIVLFNLAGPFDVDVNAGGNPYAGGQLVNINGAPGNYVSNFTSFANWDMYFKTIIGGVSQGNGNQNIVANQPINAATGTAVVTVVDNIAPVFANCPTNITTVATSASGAVVNYTAPVGTDNCSAITTRTSGLASGSAFPIGTTVVTYVAIDPSGNTVQCSFTVTVSGLAPSILCPSNITVTNAPGQCGTNTSFAATETRAIPASTISYSIAPGSFFPVGTTTVTATATNAVGVSTCTFTITVADTQFPVLAGIPADETVECNAIPAPAVVTATDNCSTSVPVYRETRTNGDCTGRYRLTRAWSTTDASGNTTTASQVITVEDTQRPVLSPAPADVTVDCNAVPAVVTLTATDNCDPAPVVTYNEARANGDCANSYTLIRTWTATDACGNTSSSVQTITVLDRTAPVLSPAPADATVECGAVPAAATLTATDNCDAAPVVTYNESRTNGACANSYTLTRTWTATDACGNASRSVQTITVLDRTAPVLSPAPADASVECNAVPAAVTLTATDNCDAAPVVTFTESRADGTCANSYNLTRVWTATDACGNTSSKTQVVTVQDTQKPVLSAAPGNITVECNAVPAAAILTATDNCSTPVVGYAEVRTNGNCTGNYILTRTWTATDACGNTCHKTQVITVQDTQKPVLSAVPADITVECDAVPAVAILTATDNCDSAPVVAYAEVKTNGNCSGNYILTRTWTATDACGNATSKTQVITVQDTQKPVLSAAPGNTTVACNAVPAPAELTATDNCSTPAVVYAETRTNGSSLYNYILTRTWTATDACGNSCTRTQVIMVQDTKAPVVTTPANISVNNDLNVCGATVNFTATATDNCSPVAITYSKNPGAVFNIGTTTVTVTSKDLAGNTTITSFTVTVTDTQKPAITAVPNQVFCANVTGTNYTIPVLAASDNCGVATISYAVSGVTTRTGSGTNASGTFNAGLSTITWTVTDVNGNVSTSVTTIKINTLPVASIASSNADAFCSKLTLTASSTINPASYRWVSGSSTFGNTQAVSLDLTNGDGIYSVFVTDAVTGCVSAAAATYNYQKQSLVNSYTILAYKDVKIGRYNKVNSGSVGVMTSKGEAEFGSYSGVTGQGSFVKAPQIDKKGYGITLNSQLIGLAAVTLPTMQYNTASTKGLPNLNASTQNATINGNYGNLTVKKGVSVTVTGNTFGTIKLEEGASIKFTSPVLNIESLMADKGAKNNTYSYIRFTGSTSVRISSKVSFGSQVWVNPDNTQVTFFMADLKPDEEKFTVKGGDTKVTANIYMPDGKLRVTATDSDDDDHNSCDHRAHSSWNCGHKGHEHNDCDHKGHNAGDCGDDVYMTGLFIAETVESKGNTVIWNSFSCGAAPAVLTGITPAAVNKVTAEASVKAVTSEEELKVTVMPNPSTTFFTLKFESKYETPRHNYSSGTYYAEIIQGGTRKVIQLIKARG